MLQTKMIYGKSPDDLASNINNWFSANSFVIYQSHCVFVNPFDTQKFVASIMFDDRSAQ